MWHRTIRQFDIPVKKGRLSKSSKKSTRTFLVSLSVKNSQGLLEKFEFRSMGPAREQVVQEAFDAAKAAGYEPWVLLDVVELLRGDELIGA